MKTTTFTEFCRHAASYFNDVENGEKIRILRYGKPEPVAEIILATEDSDTPSWKKAPLKLAIKGASLTKEIMRERNESAK